MFFFSFSRTMSSRDEKKKDAKNYQNNNLSINKTNKWKILNRRGGGGRWSNSRCYWLCWMKWYTKWAVTAKAIITSRARAKPRATKIIIIYPMFNANPYGSTWILLWMKQSWTGNLMTMEWFAFFLLFFFILKPRCCYCVVPFCCLSV